MNIGYSSRLPYDEQAYQDRTLERTDPFLYSVNPNQVYNGGQCFTGLGPRASRMGNEVSTPIGHPVATAQYVTDVESILTNRNLPANRCKDGEMNPINVTKFGLKHLPTCNGFLDPLASRLTYPPFNIKEMPIDRFYDLPTNPQLPIFYDFAVNTKLETKDNFVYSLNTLKINDPVLPKEYKNYYNSCAKPKYRY